MPRKAHATARRPILTETESALNWELRRARAEINILRKARRDGAERRDYLSPAEIAVLIRKIGTMVRNCLPAYLRDDDPCPHCGGHSVAQIEAAFEAWAEAEGGREDIEGD
ncbi:hypothetical protein GCM10009069_28870 [Algimonas arctica]|uniref:Uncharacterized protein n=1 Tax=Algimonas arctica TaxID=1479486 RepID=A0A8J3CUA1_9PROT|nr:hypothetical protein [Algimonas arctica]GHB04478.1 hypothetical protein GCM10009069_28870 [Algimonas arctica]